MKATRKLIPAFAMLLIAAVMMSTATFAWFSTNATVTADGMAITAKSDNIFITISNTATNIEQNTAIEATANPEVSGERLPAKAVASTDGLTWFTGVGKDANNGEAKDELENITEVSNIAELYYVTTTFYIRSATGFPTAYDLKLSDIIVAKDEDADSLSVFAGAIAIALKTTDAEGNETYTVYSKNTNTATYNYDQVIAEEVTSEGTITVEVYVFINGEHENIKSALATADNMTNMNITLKFTAGEDSN